MKPYMKRFCDFAYKVLKDGEPRTGRQLFELLHARNPKATRYISNPNTCVHALKADIRFRNIGGSKGSLWTLA